MRITMSRELEGARPDFSRYSRMRGFPDVSASVRRALGTRAFFADKGHFLGHASGGVLDINLFPQRRELNRGWIPQSLEYGVLVEDSRWWVDRCGWPTRSQ